MACDSKKSKEDTINTNLNIKPDFKFKDDMSMMLAWQNYCWMHYSWSVSHAAMIQAAYQKQLQPNNFNSFPSQPAPNNHAGQTPSVQPSYVYKLASIQKRITAESIDFLLLAFIKVFVIFMLYGDEYIEHFNFILIIDEKTSYDDIHWMFLQTLLFRLVVIAYEGYCISNTLPFSHGWTLGKHIMDIKVIYATEVNEENLEEQLVRVSPKPLGVLRSCCRSILKNMSISFLFPMFLPIIMFNNNRLIYDMSVGSLVVEKRPRENR